MSMWCRDSTKSPQTLMHQRSGETCNALSPFPCPHDTYDWIAWNVVGCHVTNCRSHLGTFSPSFLNSKTLEGRYQSSTTLLPPAEALLAIGVWSNAEILLARSALDSGVQEAVKIYSLVSKQGNSQGQLASDSNPAC